ncbi:MAG: deoxyribose-phosphate aldolase [Spirulinaceae cyanobacterium SM2_1_0]|nr:deoxyribose-phosphate aldolase [Spirulinaceae cyanobacterium SM2_1_0]
MNPADYPEIDLAPHIEQAVLHPATTTEQVQRACAEAVQHNFASVCVYPAAVAIAVEALHNRSPQVCTVIGFPTGATTAATKLYEAHEAAEQGATELDVMINLGWLKSGRHDELHREIAQICEETGQTVKAILEVGLLAPDEMRQAAEICLDAGASYLKTNTGWFGGATVTAVSALHDLTRGRAGIKAAGGIRTASQALDLILAGATRLGTSRGPELLAQRDRPAIAPEPRP